MTVNGKISGDPDKTPLDGTEKVAAAAGGVNYGLVLNTIAAWLATKTQTLTHKTIDAAGNTLSNLTLAMFASGVADTDGALAANSDTRVATQRAVKAYVDTVAQGLDPKQSVLCATTANITLSGEQTIDGVATSTARVLVKNQSTASQNGIYVSAAGAWARAADADSWAELPGAYVFVERGTANADCGFVCTVDQGGSLGSTAVTFVQFAGAGTMTSGNGITVTGTSIALANMAASTVKGNAAGSPAAPADLTLGAGLAMSGSSLAIDGAFGLRNRLINPSGQIWARANSTAAAITDVTYAFDRWYGLTQSAGVTASQVSNAENGTPYMMRLTQANASAQRFGLAQVIESGNCLDLRGKTVALSGRVRMSAATTLRYAIVEWTGTADTVTKDIVNSWTNGTFTAGQFFTSTGTTVAATGSIALAANTLTDMALTAAISGSANNVFAFFWTDSAQAQNVTLDIGKVQLEIGAQATQCAVRPYSVENDLCQYYFEKVAPGAGTVGIGGFESTSRLNLWTTWKREKRIAPTVTFSAASDWNVRQNAGAVSAAASSISVGSTRPTVNGCFCDCNVATTPFTAGQFGILQVSSSTANYTVDAEL